MSSGNGDTEVVKGGAFAAISNYVVRPALNATDPVVVKAGDSLGAGCFLSAILGLAFLDGHQNNEMQNIALTGWIGTNVLASFIFPWFLNQYRIHITATTAYALSNTAYAVGSFQMGEYELATFGAMNAAGNFIALFNKLVLTPERLSRWFKASARECGEPAIQARIQLTKNIANWGSVTLRGACRVPLALKDWEHAIIACVSAIGLYFVHRRAHLVALNPTEKSLSPMP